MQLLCAALSRTARSSLRGRRERRRREERLNASEDTVFSVSPLEERSSVMEADSAVDV